jgi:hypothetical protein
MPSYYIVLEKEIPNLDVYVNGNYLSKNSENLEQLAKQLGIPTLMSFFSVNPNELSSLLGEPGFGEAGGKADSERWFNAEDGLQTIRALSNHFEHTEPTAHGQIVSELREFDQVLSAAQQQGIRWHLSVDY